MFLFSFDVKGNLSKKTILFMPILIPESASAIRCFQEERKEVENYEKSFWVKYKKHGVLNV
jgi:hypothetical protein